LDSDLTETTPTIAAARIAMRAPTYPTPRRQAMPIRHFLDHRPWAAALLCSLSALAAAQPASVTVFSVLDIGLQQLTNGSKRLNQQSIDGLQTSRLGFRGTEDLGGGMLASFHLEGALAPDTGGPAGLSFTRRSTVSLSNQLGELRLGRDYTPTFWNISRFNAFGTNGVGAASNLIYGFDGSSGTAPTVVRSSNAIGYFLPGELGGVYGQAMVAPSEGAAAGKFVGARLGYAAGALDVAASVSDTTNNAAGEKYNVTSLGGTYALGNWKVIGLLHNSKQASKKQDNWVLGGTYTMGQTTLRASYTHAHFSNSAAAAKADYTGRQLAVGGLYALSKRTALYGTVSQVSNSATGKFLIPGGSAITAGQGSRGTELGINHTF
jgi:predicted porin